MNHKPQLWWRVSDGQKTLALWPYSAEKQKLSPEVGRVLATQIQHWILPSNKPGVKWKSGLQKVRACFLKSCQDICGQAAPDLGGKAEQSSSLQGSRSTEHLLSCSLRHDPISTFCSRTSNAQVTLLLTEEPREWARPLGELLTSSFAVCSVGNAVFGGTVQLGIKYYTLTSKLSRCKLTAIADTIWNRQELSHCDSSGKEHPPHPPPSSV